MIAALWFVVLAGLFAVGAYFGIGLYAHRARILAALEVLRGRVSLSENGKQEKHLVCAREHLDANCVAIRREDLKKLEAAAHELKIARGYIAHCESLILNPNMKSYAEIVDETLGAN